MNRHVDTINQSIAYILERIYRLELGLNGLRGELTVLPRSNSTADALKKSLIETRRISTLLQLLHTNLLTQEEARKYVEKLNLFS
jgi:hypothetical protein